MSAQTQATRPIAANVTELQRPEWPSGPVEISGMPVPDELYVSTSVRMIVAKCPLSDIRFVDYSLQKTREGLFAVQTKTVAQATRRVQCR